MVIWGERMICVDTKMRSESVPAPLPKTEAVLYLFLWLLFALRAVYAVFLASKEYEKYIKYALEDSDAWPNWNKDVTDQEWCLIRNVVADGYVLYIIVHIIVGQVLVHFCSQKYLPAMLSLCGICSVVKLIGVPPVLLLLGHCGVLVSAAVVSSSAIIVWIISILTFVSLNSVSIQKSLVNLGVLMEHDSMLSEYGICMSLLRSTSVALYICSCKSNVEPEMHALKSEASCSQEHFKTVGNNWNTKSLFCKITDVLCYIFYLPLFFAGPLMTYENFNHQFSRTSIPMSWNLVSHVLCLLFRVILWALIFEIYRHLFYAAAIMVNVDIMQSCSLWTVAGVSYLQGQFFMVKYFVIFGFGGAIAKLDRLQTAGPPKCVSYIYRYSEMWRSFDGGMYDVMISHIYIPLGGSRHGTFCHFTASSLCFLFVCLWHGLWSNIQLWIVANIMTLAMEMVGDYVYGLPCYRQLELKFCSPATIRRLHAVFAMPQLAVSAFAIFTFFTSTEVGYTIFYRLIVLGYPTSTFLCMVALYVFIQTSKEMQRLCLLRNNVVVA